LAVSDVVVGVTNRSGQALPEYATAWSAGADVRARLERPEVLMPGERRLVPTGLSVALPAGFELQVRPRSGLALKYGITVLNAPGTIDADYRGEIKVLLINHGQETFEIQNGERIAQMVVAQHAVVQWANTTELNVTERGDGGYGSTGLTKP
jgi:dUTP pyrophosphatase